MNKRLRKKRFNDRTHPIFRSIYTCPLCYCIFKGPKCFVCGSVVIGIQFKPMVALVCSPIINNEDRVIIKQIGWSIQ